MQRPLVVRRSAIAAAAALSALAWVTGAGAAGASGRPSALGRLTLSRPAAVEKSTVFAGYTSEATGITTVAATLTVPHVTTCTASEDAGMGPVVIVDGPKYFVGAGAEASCDFGSITYQIAVNYNGSEKKFLTVRPKDKITVSITLGRTTTTVAITDVTSKQSTSRVVPAGKVQVASLGDDTLENLSTHKALPIPSFTNHQFTAVKVNGKPLAKATPLVRQELVKGSKVLVQAGLLTSGGTAFKMYFKAAG